MVQVPQTMHINLLLTKGTSLKGEKKKKLKTVLVQLAYFHTFVEWQQTQQGWSNSHTRSDFQASSLSDTTVAQYCFQRGVNNYKALLWNREEFSQWTDMRQRKH